MGKLNYLLEDEVDYNERVRKILKILEGGLTLLKIELNWKLRGKRGEERE